LYGQRLRWLRGVLKLLLLGVLVMPAGCSKEEIKQKLEEAKTQAQSLKESAVQAVEEKLPETGSFTLQMSPTAAPIKKADLEVISIGDGRPNIVQIVSYDPAKTSRSYPTVMLHGATTATSASALSGETVQCDMYFQASSSAPIAVTKPGGSVAVTFGSLNTEDNALSATLGMAELIGSDDKPVQIQGGDVVAVIRGEGN
jgi:hypothetical protein